jgi:regulator of protease activity HflC (stomatin/prohibitin superfamily)
MSKDNVHLFIAVTVIYRVVDTLAFAYKLTSSPEDCIRDMASSHLLNILGTHLLQDIIEHPFEIS